MTIRPLKKGRDETEVDSPILYIAVHLIFLLRIDWDGSKINEYTPHQQQHPLP